MGGGCAPKAQCYKYYAIDDVYVGRSHVLNEEMKGVKKRSEFLRNEDYF